MKEKIKNLFGEEWQNSTADPNLDEKERNELLQQEIPLIAALLRVFSQRNIIDELKYLLTEKGLPYKAQKLKTMVKDFIKEENIPLISQRYHLSPKRALEILSSVPIEKIKKYLANKDLYTLSRYNTGLPFIFPLKDDFPEKIIEKVAYVGQFLPLSPEAMKRVDPSWWPCFLEEALNRAFYWGEGTITLWLDLLEKDELPHLTPQMLWPLAQGAFLCGRLKFLEKLAPELKPWQSLFLKALQAFLSKQEEYLSILEEAEKAFRAHTRKRLLVIEGPLGIFLPVMLALAKDPEIFAQAKKIWPHYRKLVPERWRELIYPLTDWLNALERKIPFISWSFKESSFSFEKVIKLWTFLLVEDDDVSPAYKEHLLYHVLSLAKEQEKIGLKLWALELYGFVEIVDEDHEEAAERLRFINEETGWSPVSSHFFEDLSWEVRLHSLEKLLNKKFEEKDARLIWCLDFRKNYIQIIPKEQKKKKDGTWTSGRPVALKRLARGEYPYLTEADRKVTKHIIVEEYGYGRYSRQVYDFSPEAILALEGHPLVFDENTGAPLKVVRERPKLIVKHKKEGFYVELFPLFLGNDAIILREGNLVRIFVYGPEEQQIANIIDEKLFIPAKAAGRLQSLLPLLSQKFELISDVETKNLPQVPPESRPRLVLRPRGEGLLLSVRVFPLGGEDPSFIPGEDQIEVVAKRDGEWVATKRDLETEKRFLAEIEQELSQLEGLEKLETAEWLAPDLEVALNLLEVLESLKAKGFSLLWPEGKALTILIPEKEPSLALRSAKDWFEVKGKVEIGDQSIPLERILKGLREKKAHFIPLGEDKFLRLKKNILQKFEEILQLAEIKGNKVRVHPLQALALSEKTALEGDQRFKALKERFSQVMAKEPAPPQGLAAIMRPYQLEGFRWLRKLYDLELGACLADDMGLGKTLQTLALLLDVAQEGPSLVVAPASVLSVWLDEAQRFTPELRMLDLGRETDRQKALENLGPKDVVLISYGLLQREETVSSLQKINWNVIILDEAQHIKNYRTKRARNAFSLKARFRVATTGTPIENRLEELWAIFRFLIPGFLGSLESFRSRFVIPIEQKKDQKAQEALKTILRPFILRRTKEEVLTELPPRTELTIKVDFSPEEAALYEALRKEALEELKSVGNEPASRFDILAHLTRLRLFCCSPRLVLEKSIPESKLAVLIELLEEIISSGHKVLVFSQFVRFLKRIEEALRAKKISPLFLDGSLPQTTRAARIKEFQQGKAPIFLISLKAGGFGLNLTAADYVIIADPWWNPAVERQAADRAHRLGQTRPVTIYRLVVKNSVEEKVLELQKEKRLLAEKLLSGTETPQTINLEDLISLLS